MSDNKIKIYFMWPGVNDAYTAAKFMHIENLPFVKNFMWDEKDPDYIIATDRIYFTPEYAKKFLELSSNEPNKNGNFPIRILFLLEALAPDLNLFDYAVSWNRNFSYIDRVSRIPPRFEPHMANYIGEIPGNENDLTFDEAKVLLAGKKRFCNFMYSKGAAHPYRNELFYALNSYKKIDSTGSYLNNVNTLIVQAGEKNARESKNWIYTGIRIKSHYKFSIECENAIFDGYTSEKLLAGFHAHTVPIYWGNPYIAEEYNPEAFINCHDYDSIDSVVKRVKEIDEDDNLWAHIVRQPWQTEAQKEVSKTGWENYRKFMTNIFTTPIREAVRRPLGFWPNIYERFTTRAFQSHHNTLMRRIVRAVSNPDIIMEWINRKYLARKLTSVDKFFNE